MYIFNATIDQSYIIFPQINLMDKILLKQQIENESVRRPLFTPKNIVLLTIRFIHK